MKRLMIWNSYLSILGTNGYNEGVKYPRVNGINSKLELYKYYNDNKKMYDLEKRENHYIDETIGFLDVIEKYDDNFFKKKTLVLILLEEGNGSIRYKVVDVRKDNNLEFDILKISE